MLLIPVYSSISVMNPSTLFVEATANGIKSHVCMYHIGKLHISP